MQRHLRLRPLLQIRTAVPPDQVIRRLKDLLSAPETKITGTITGNYIVLRIEESRQHFGSPQLSFDVEPLDGGSKVAGLFMPMPSIWTAFMALYALILFGGFCAACYGYAQLKLEHPPMAFWGVPVALLLVAGVHLVACIGQRRGHDQMQELQRFVQRALACGD